MDPANAPLSSGIPPSDTAAEPQASPKLPEIDDLRAQFPELEIQSLLGQGGMGLVYLARQKHLDRQVALKILRPDIATDVAFAERFTREARTLARLAHPAILGLHDFGIRNGTYYFVMEYVDGTNLRQVVKESKLKPAEALAIVPMICDALQYAHDHGVVHRDIKPENILLGKNGQVKIADFGLAKLVRGGHEDFTLTGTRQVMGTPQYMAPEQIERPQEVDHRADIYSLGVVLYELLTGELPIGRFAPPSQKVRIDVKLDEVVLRALEKEPQRRYQTATEVKTSVEHATETAGNRTHMSPVPDTGLLYDLRWPAIGLFIAVLIDLFAGFALLSSSPLGILHLLVVGVLGFGAWQMFKRCSLGWALAAALLGVTPIHFGVIIAFPMSIWALFLMTHRGGSQTFATADRPHGLFRRAGNVVDRVESTLYDQLAKAPQRWQKSKAAATWLSQAIMRRITAPLRWPWRTLAATLGFMLTWLLVVAIATFWIERSWVQNQAPREYYVNDGTAGEFIVDPGSNIRVSALAMGSGNLSPGTRDMSGSRRRVLNLRIWRDSQMSSKDRVDLVIDLEPTRMRSRFGGRDSGSWQLFSTKSLEDAVGRFPDEEISIARLEKLYDAIVELRSSDLRGPSLTLEPFSEILDRHAFRVVALGELSRVNRVSDYVYAILWSGAGVSALAGLLLILTIATRPRRRSRGQPETASAHQQDFAGS
ncbi:MAG: serine/threonine-protein kinase [Pirellulaceae bacterium]